MYIICSEARFVKISSPNECDKILKIPNEQTEPKDYMANCSTDLKADNWSYVRLFLLFVRMFLLI